MPLPITQYQIFLGSPGELSDERTLIEDVIKELNITFGMPNQISLQLLKWETHSAPAVTDNHVQEIINNDIGQSYDLFIGLLWKRFGTPTNKAESGTEEEFLHAYDRFQNNPNSLQILFYFKNAPITPDVDLVQLGKVQKFKKDIINKNVLYGDYSDGEQLSSFLRIHIPKRILQIHNNQSNKKEISEVVIDEVYTSDILIEEEYGLIDYQEQFEESIENSNQALSRITESMNWISDQFSKKTIEITELSSKINNPPSRKTVRSIMVRISKSMGTFGKRIETETPIFFDNFQNAINAMQKTLEIYRSDFRVDQDEALETKESLIELIIEMNGALPATQEFVQSIEDLPRMSKEINMAKSDLKNKLDELVKNIVISISISNDLLDSFNDFIDN
ncbi:uncharacterized protein DUF4062 [Nonlabens xylanidelens]|uniref:Uncharacterized protein DUF4062 n=1 Tax=Nonlabens xylanidelens TaxID=191564 RepID=A0A2S6IMU9_9FLAO|nr:DUF4062 domain-containing protein [Nonlabens xylanidelens]PPK95564.1 uncharacterized protein DUF4062 [Nonlabens xylanidelens]PQJ22371.1 hypothetical protein BST94_02015 [Nonlabens xylanidelens]